MNSQNKRISRITDIIIKNENEIKLINRFLSNPFGRGQEYKDLINSQRVNNSYNPSFYIVVWVLNILLWGMFIFGFSSIDKLIIQAIIFIVVTIVGVFIGNTLRLIFFCSRRKKELKLLISVNQKKLDELEEE